MKINCPSCGRQVEPEEILLGTIIVGFVDDDPQQPTHGGSGCRYCVKYPNPAVDRILHNHYICGYEKCAACDGKGVSDNPEFNSTYRLSAGGWGDEIELCHHCEGRRVTPLYLHYPTPPKPRPVDLGPDNLGELQDEAARERFEYAMEEKYIPDSKPAFSISQHQ